MTAMRAAMQSRLFAYSQRVAPNSRRILRWIPRIRAASTCEAARPSALMLSMLSIALKFASAGSSTACHHFASPRHGGTTRNIGKCECAGSAAKIRAEEKCCRPRRAACHDLFGEDIGKDLVAAQCSGRLSDLRVCLFALAKNLYSSAISRTRGRRSVTCRTAMGGVWRHQHSASSAA